MVSTENRTKDGAHEPPTSRALQPLFDSIGELSDALADPQGSASHPALAVDAVDELARRCEIGVWEVLMPHLIRSAPELRADTVTRLQDNHQLEKQLLDVVLGRVAGAESGSVPPELRARLVSTLRSSLDLLQAEVAPAFDALPGEQRQALIDVLEHERLRAAGEDPGPANRVAEAVDTLETDRSSLPLPIAANK